MVDKTSHQLHRDSPSHVEMVFPNGVAVSIIDNGYGSVNAPFEAYVADTHQHNGHCGDLHKVQGWDLGHLIPSGDGRGIYGWLTAEKLGELLAAAAALRA